MDESEPIKKYTQNSWLASICSPNPQKHQKLANDIVLSLQGLDILGDD
jgi:hypothetical protein